MIFKKVIMKVKQAYHGISDWFALSVQIMFIQNKMVQKYDKKKQTKINKSIGYSKT